MTNAELVEELRKWPPHAPVRVCTRTAYIVDEMGEDIIPLCEEDAQEADEVRGEGGFLLIWGGR